MTPVSADPYRDWLRQRLSAELGVREADLAVQGAVQRRGWTAVRALGPRDVIAVLQDVYSQMRENFGDARADKWLEGTTLDLAKFAESVPVPAQSTAPGPIAPAPSPVKWGRRAHDLPLLLARSHAEIASRSLGAIRTNPDLLSLERAAEWDVQATQAEVRRWETEEMLSKLRADHARIEVADQVAAAVAQGELLRLTVQELEDASRSGQVVSPQLAHSRLMVTQTRAFLEAFTPLIDLEDADTPLTMLELDLSNVRFSLGVPLHPNVLRARHAAWSPGYVQQNAARLGFLPGIIPGRMVLPASEAGLPPVVGLAFDTQAALADDPAQSAIRELTLSLDVPQVDRAERPFERMREAADALALEMDGVITDGDAQLLREETMDAIGADLEQLYDTLESRDLAAGSPLARRLFS